MLRPETLFFKPDDGVNSTAGEARAPSPLERLPLHPRGKDVFRLLANGYTQPEIAKHLNISYKTVRSHIYGGEEWGVGLVDRLGAENTLDAIIHAIPFISFKTIVDPEKIKKVKTLNEDQKSLLEKRIQYSSYSHEDFAKAVAVPVSTVKHHLTEINKHIGVHTNIGAVAAYLAVIEPSPQQQEVLRLAAYGFKQKGIAGRMKVLPSTIDSYMYGKSGDAGLFDKFRVDTRTGLVIKAARMHFLDDVIHEYDIKRLNKLNGEQIGLLQVIADNTHLKLPELAAELSRENQTKITREMLEQQLGTIYRLTGAPNMTAAALLLIAGQQQDSRYVSKTYHFPERRVQSHDLPKRIVPREEAPVGITMDDVYRAAENLRRKYGWIPSRYDIAAALGVEIEVVNPLFDKMRAQASPRQQPPDRGTFNLDSARIGEETEQAWKIKEQMDAHGTAPVIVFDSTQEEERTGGLLDEETIRAMRRFPLRQRRALELLYGIDGQIHEQHDVARELHMTLREVKRAERALRRRVRTAYLGRIRKRKHRR